MSERRPVTKLTASILREQLSYCPDTGEFRWRVSKNRVSAGDKTGRPNSSGHHVIGVLGRTYSAHRLAWLYAYGEWPEGEIDHIDRDKTNNSLVNLRCATRRQNNCNVGRRRDNTSGIKGVQFRKRRWLAYISVDGCQTYLGSFRTADAATAAYRDAAVRTQGEFATFE